MRESGLSQAGFRTQLSSAMNVPDRPGSSRQRRVEQPRRDPALASLTHDPRYEALLQQLSTLSTRYREIIRTSGYSRS